MIPSPKDRFLSDVVLAKHHTDTVSTTQFAAALDAALLEYGAQCSRGKRKQAGLLLRGAHEFARLFCELSQPRTQTKTIDRDNL